MTGPVTGADTQLADTDPVAGSPGPFDAGGVSERERAAAAAVPD